MTTKARLTGENFHKKIGTGKKSLISSNSSFYMQTNKSETYPTIIQMLKNDLIQVQNMINQNSSDSKMYKLLSKTPGLTKKLTEIEEKKSINNRLDKIFEDSKNIEFISKIYNCQGNELIQKLFLELSYYELLLKKLYDYFILMKLKIYKDDTYQESLSKIIPIQIFMEEAKKLSPGYGGINDSIVQLSVDKENLLKKITELENKHNNLLKEVSNKNNNIEELTKYKNDINIKDKEIKKLKEEIEELNKSKNVPIKSDKDNNINNKIIFKNSKEFKKILSDFEKKIKKSRNNFCDELSNELAELQVKHKNKEDEYDVLVAEKNKLLKKVEYLSGRKLDPNSYEEVLREQSELMRQTFLQKIDDLNDELINIKQDSRMKIYRMEEEIKEKNELKDTFLNQVISLQEKLEIK